jgi:hypothetical protein
MSLLGRRPLPPSGAAREHGQSIAEFAIILPVILLLLVGIADLGRLYTSVVAVESASREAADFGAFDATNWDTSIDATKIVTYTLPEMEKRACSAAMGSHLQDYETPVTDGTTCTNPAMTCTLERNGASAECGGSGGFTNGVNCSDPAIEPPCTVHVRMDYQFHLILAIPPFPSTIAITRDSYFRISDLEPLPSPTP